MSLDLQPPDFRNLFLVPGTKKESALRSSTPPLPSARFPPGRHRRTVPSAAPSQARTAEWEMEPRLHLWVRAVSWSLRHRIFRPLAPPAGWETQRRWETRGHGGETRGRGGETRGHGGETRRHGGETRRHGAETRGHGAEPGLEPGLEPGSGVALLGHTPVMVREVLDALRPAEGQVILDMTFGAGGHARALIGMGAQVLALDRDPGSFELARHLAQSHGGSLRPLLGRISELPKLLSLAGVAAGSLDGVLIDAGCSSLQMDDASRGFSLSRDGPLDMRMGGEREPESPTAYEVLRGLPEPALASVLHVCVCVCPSEPESPTAYEVLRGLPEPALASVLRRYGEERHSRSIARAVAGALSAGLPIRTTRQLAMVVAGAVPQRAVTSQRDALGRRAHVATRTFQALRIFVNDELNELLAGLGAAAAYLKPGGRLVAISFHSLEDRIVKRFIMDVPMTEKHNMATRHRIWKSRRDRQGRFLYGDDDEVLEEEVEEVTATRTTRRKFRALSSPAVVYPGEEELRVNPRARSAKLRAAVKL
uniref:Probable methyltransferase-like protein 15 n=1 Tax=Petromyzon marinus TaxID=7757 RepID=A0AAJ7UK93_PETMA|nr:probable methyltransferase-like protein 15 [Petromyzon marinus]